MSVLQHRVPGSHPSARRPACRGFGQAAARSRLHGSASRVSAQQERAPTSEQKLRVVRQFYEEGWSASDLDSLDAIIAEDHVQEDRVWQAQPRHGRESLKKGIAYIQRSYPDVRFRVDHAALTGDGARAFVRWTMTGTFEGQPDTAHGAALLTLDSDCMICRTEVFRQATRAEVLAAQRGGGQPVPQGALLAGQQGRGGQA